MKILIKMKKIVQVLLGDELRNTFERNSTAADQLDNAVKEMLRK